MPALIDRIDHLVLTTAHEAQCVHFYCTVLGMELQTFGAGRKALVWNGQKINLHLQGHELEPKAKYPTPGSLDLCAHGVVLECGPVERTGACGPIRSVYVRGPDANLIEICEYLSVPQ